MNVIWTKLPPEMLPLVKEQTDHKPTLTSWSCVCQRLRRLATRQLCFEMAKMVALLSGSRFIQTHNLDTTMEFGKLIEHVDIGLSTLMSGCEIVTRTCIQRDRERRDEILGIAASDAKSVHFYGFFGSHILKHNIWAYRGIKQLKLRVGNFGSSNSVQKHMVNHCYRGQENLDFEPLSMLKKLRVLSIGDILIEEEEGIAKGIRHLALIQLELAMRKRVRPERTPLTRFFSALVSDKSRSKEAPVGFPATLRKLTLANKHGYLPVHLSNAEIQKSLSACKNLTHLKLNFLCIEPYFEIFLNLKFPKITYLGINPWIRWGQETFLPSSAQVEIFCQVCSAYQATLKFVEVMNAPAISFLGFFHSANLWAAESKNCWRAQELRLECHKGCDLINLQGRLFSMRSDALPSEDVSFQWGTELSRIRIGKLRSCLPRFSDPDVDPWLVQDLNSLRILVIDKIFSSQAPSLNVPSGSYLYSRPLRIFSCRLPERDDCWIYYIYDENTKANVLLEMASTMVSHSEPLPALRILYLDSERYWIERNGPSVPKVWRLWDAMDDPVQRAQIDREISHADWAFLSDRRINDTVTFLPS